jgi:hypothetical protein
MARKEILLEEAKRIVLDCQRTVQGGQSRVGKAVFRMIDTWRSGQITAVDLTAIIEDANQRMMADVTALPVASIQQALLPWPSETLETLMAIRLGQYALSEYANPLWANHELQQMSRLLAEHEKALRVERKVTEEAHRQNRDSFLMVFEALTASAALAVSERYKPNDSTTRDLAAEIETIVNAIEAGLNGQSNKALDLLPNPAVPGIAEQTRTGRDLLALWEREGAFLPEDDRPDSPELARQIREEAWGQR